MPQKSLHLLIVFHMLLSFGGLFLHVGIHPPTQSLYFWWAAPISGISIVVLPPLFFRASTVGIAVLMNAFSVVTGVVGMAYFSLLNPPDPFTPGTLFMNTTLVPIALLLTKLPLAQAILRERRRTHP